MTHLERIARVPGAWLAAPRSVDVEAEVRSFCEARDWDQFHGPKDLAIGTATEAA